MFEDLPRVLRCIVFDFCGDISLEQHRRPRFVNTELLVYRFLAVRHGVQLCPSYARRATRLENIAQVIANTYAESQSKSVFKHYMSGGIP